MKKYLCEGIGTAILVLFGCGTAVITGGNLVATSLAFGLSIIALAYVIGGVSGCHINPAVSLAMYLTKKIDKKDFLWYVIAQIIGALCGSLILYLILDSTTIGTANLGANGYGSMSAVRLNLLGAIITEIILTFVFIFTILGVTNDKKKDSIAGIVIGLTLTFVHIIGINLTGTSVNPARSIAPAIILGGKALQQVWVFVVAPLVGSTIATFTYKYINSK
ncbi:MAG: MIP family channel protein [Bacilli bacterium]|nr:MIP family channel protein [Bacilli bacterium]